MNIKRMLIAAALAAGMATGASAATLTGTTSGVFRSDNIGPSTNSCRFDNGGGANSAVAWGDPNSCPDTNGVDQDDSTLSIQSFVHSDTISGAQSIQIGQIDWFNERNTDAEDFAAIADILWSLTSPITNSFSEALAFNITNTANTPNDPDNILALTFSDFGLPLPVSFGGITLTGFSFELVSPITGESLTEGPSRFGGGSELIWLNPEGNTSSLAIKANVVASAVPLPAAGWLMIAGIGGLAALRRRRKAA